MHDTLFWLRLEYHVGAWLNDNVRQGYWNDGFRPEGIKDTRHGVEVEGITWVCFGSEVLPPFRFVVSIPQKMLRRGRERFVIEDVLFNEAGRDIRIAVACEAKPPARAENTAPLVEATLRPVEISDADDIQRYASDVRLHATCNLPSPYPECGAMAFVAAAIQAREAERQFTFAVLNAGEFAGLMTLNDVRKKTGTAELDYWIALPFWGRGIATQAARLAIEHAFAVLGLHTLFSGGLVRNVGSMRVLEKNGFTKLGEFVYDGPRFAGESVARYRLQRSEFESGENLGSGRLTKQSTRAWQ
ncbi:MAG TPA: GNAT family N-acetyltransferase [Prosthecobacter sp.]